MTGPVSQNPNKHSNDRLDRRRTGAVLLRLGGYVFRQWYLFIPAIIMTLVSNHLALLGPRYSGAAIDAIGIEGGVDFAVVTQNVIYMIFCYVISALFSYALAVIMVFMSQRIVRKMRKQVFERLNTLPVSYFDTHQTGDIISRMSYDIDTINGTLSHDFVQVLTSIYSVVGSLVFMWKISKPMILVFAVTVPIMMIVTNRRAKKVRPFFRERSHKLGALNGYAEEMLSGTRTISAYGQEDAILERFDEKNKDAMTAYKKADYYSATMGPTVNFMSNISLSLIAIFGGVLYMLSVGGTVVEGTLFFITLGGVAQFVQYSRKFSGPINEFANIIHEFQSAFSAAERVFKVIDEEPEKADASDAVSLKEVKGDVEFSDVVFGYVPERTILRGISVKADDGKTIAIVGPTGAGKTTVINLLMRFYDADSGEIRLDGIPIENIRRRDLRRAFTMVLQDTWLFAGTIYENIAYGKENATRDEVISAAKAARIHSYIETLPEGYDTFLSDDGVNISKGQRQLITIARAILSDAPMLILDEATSNVDSRTEIKIQEALSELMRGRTSFVIAHRLSTIQNADTILVIRDGEISEAGNHDELMRLGGFYSTLYNSQFA